MVSLQARDARQRVTQIDVSPDMTASSKDFLVPPSDIGFASVPTQSRSRLPWLHTLSPESDDGWLVTLDLSLADNALSFVFTYKKCMVIVVKILFRHDQSL